MPWPHHGRCRLHLVWLKSIVGTSSLCFCNTAIFVTLARLSKYEWLTSNQLLFYADPSSNSLPVDPLPAVVGGWFLSSTFFCLSTQNALHSSSVMFVPVMSSSLFIVSSCRPRWVSDIVISSVCNLCSEASSCSVHGRHTAGFLPLSYSPHLWNWLLSLPVALTAWAPSQVGLRLHWCAYQRTHVFPTCWQMSVLWAVWGYYE